LKSDCPWLFAPRFALHLPASSETNPSINIYEDIARVRYLVGNGFRLLLGSDEKTAATWKKVTAQVEQRSEKIADDLLSRRH